MKRSNTVISAEEFYNDLEQFAKDYPFIWKGMTVAVYQHAEGHPLVGYGRVVEAQWSNFYHQYIYDVLMYGANQIIFSVLSCQLERAVWPRSVMKGLVH